MIYQNITNNDKFLNISAIDKSKIPPNLVNGVSYDYYDYLEFLLKDRLFAEIKSPNKVVGYVRVAQARVSIDNWEENFITSPWGRQCFDTLQSEDWSPLYKNSIFDTTFEVPSASACAFTDCREYQTINNTEGDLIARFSNGDFGTYGGHYFYAADFYYEMDYSAIINQLKTNNWIDSETRALLIRFTIKNHWIDKYYSVEATIETPATGFFEKSFFTSFLSIEEGQTGLVMTWMIILMLNCLVFFGKIVFELSIGLSILTNLLEILNWAWVLALWISKFIELTLEAEFTDEELAKEQYFNFKNLVNIFYANNFIAITCALFIPFRFFTLLSHFKFFAPFWAMIKVFYRMLGGLVTYMIIMAIIIMTWTSALFFFLEPFCFKFRTYQDSIVAVLMLDFWNDDDYQYMIAESQYSYIFSLIIVIVQFLRTSSISLYIALSVFLYKKAAASEKLDVMTPTQKIYHETLEEVKDTVDKMYHIKKEELKAKEKKYGSNQNKKIVAWMLNRKKHLNEKERQAFFKRLNPHHQKNDEDLDFESDYNIGEDEKIVVSSKKNPNIFSQSKAEDSDGLIDEHENQFIQTIQFEFPFQLKSFLKSLFQLKPILISSYSVDKFRIVIENIAMSSQASKSLC